MENGSTSGVSSYEFADGAVLSRAQMFAKMNSFQTVFGTNGADTRAGSALSEFFSLGNGNDTVLFDRGSVLREGQYPRRSTFG